MKNDETETDQPASDQPTSGQDDLDWAMPIALRKGVRSCVKYPMIPQFKGLVTQIDNIRVPKNVQEAMSDPKWKNAVMEEMNTLIKNNTWDVVTLLANQKVVACRWVFSVRHNTNGSVERYKARLVVQGFTQTYGIDYEETFAPVAKLNSIRVLIFLVVNLDWPLFQFDIKNAFLNGDLDEDIYMKMPFDFKQGAGYVIVCKLKKFLYGLKQSPRAWFKKFSMTLNRVGYK